MRRHELLHVLRAADSVTNGRVRFVVIGSQAILGTTESFNTVLIRSMEADLAVEGNGTDDPKQYADIVEGAIGNGSPFASTFGYYADGVEIETASLAPGWRDRLIPVEYDAYGQTKIADCLSAPDLAVSKLLAGREKDFEFVDAMLAEDVIDTDQIEALLNTVDESPALRRASNWLSSRRAKNSP